MRSDLRFYRQTVFYTPSALTVSEGDKIVGNLSCAPNKRNNRDLDIEINYKVEGREEEEVNFQYKMCVFISSIVVFYPTNDLLACTSSSHLPSPCLLNIHIPVASFFI
jgi:hypothetical protein